MRPTEQSISQALGETITALALVHLHGRTIKRGLPDDWCARDSAPAIGEPPSLLEWGRRFLPHYFRRAPSALHRQLEAWWSDADRERGLKLNVIGPRGGAKSTVGTLA